MKGFVISSIVTLAFCTLGHTAVAQDFDHGYGLRVVTYPSPHSDFTSLALEGGKGIPTNGETITLCCDILNRVDNVFGTIFRIITDKGDNIDLMYSISRTDQHYPILVTGEQVWEIPGVIVTDEWMPVSISLNPKDGNILVNYNGSELSIKDAGTKGARKLRISFGFCPFEGFGLDDVASVDVKDIRIERNGKLIRHWKMNLHDGDCCTDEVHHSEAIGANTKWLIDRYVTWKPVFHEKFPGFVSMAFDPLGIFYMSYDGKTITTFDVNKDKREEIAVTGATWPGNCPGCLLFLDNSGKLISYNVDENIVATYSPEKHEWSGTREISGDSNYWNKTTSLTPDGKSLYAFGGYGHYNFKNDLIVFDSETGEGINTQITDITPRYGCASVIVDTLMYIFGGRGNLSGKQELNPKYYYDLYAIDIRSLDVTKLWDCNEMSSYGHFLPGENLLYDKDSDAFYTMTNLEGGTLARFSRTEPSLELMSLPTGNYESSQFTNYNLYINRRRDKIYSAQIKSQVNGSSSVYLYEMDFPAIPVTLLKQSSNEEDGTKDPMKAVIFALLGVIAAMTVGLLHYSKSMKRKAAMNMPEPYEADRKYYDFSRSSICFLGGFSAKDKNGNDITSQFTPTLKYLVVLLILYTGKDPNGIISNKLNRLLWSYKSEDSANNNRNVYISKLRGILEQIGDVTVCNQNKFWNIRFGEGSSCDYLEVMRIFNDQATENNVNRLLELMLRGMMLPSIELDWVDSFKSEFSNRTIDFLTKQMERDDLPEDVLISAADTVFQHDYLNQEALKYKCRMLCKQGKSGLSKAAYDNFCKEYKESIGEVFSISFKDIIG